MAVGHHIRNPVEWGLEQLRSAGRSMEEAGRHLGGIEETRYSSPPEIRRIEIADLKEVVARGIDDFGVCRTDVIVLAAIYPLIGLILARLAFGYDMLPLLFPLAAGFALMGPVAAIGLYEMSRMREQGAAMNWAHAFGFVRSPRLGAIVALGLLLLAIFIAWLVAAQAIYSVTLGPEPPASVASFVNDTFATTAGRVMIGAGLVVGMLFALLVLMISVVSFPMLLDRNVGLPTAMATSIRAVTANPVPMLAWGVVVAVSLAIAMIPLFLGLAIVVPVLGHATWHLYRKVVEPPASQDQT